MASKRVLLTYLERNKIIAIPDETEEGDVNYAKKEFQRAFSFEGHATVILQKFDQEWDTYIDLEDDDALVDRDKIKVVVMSVFEEKLGSTTETPSDAEKCSDVSLSNSAAATN